MRLLGLTGDIAAGKSTVAHLLEEKGAALIDADALVRELYADPAFAAQVVALFETHFWDAASQSVRAIVDAHGGIDRTALGALVFRDAAALRKLEALVHPAVAALRAHKIKALRQSGKPPVAVVLEAVKLIESGQHIGCDAIWWIRARLETQMSRLMQHRLLDEAAARARLANQPPAQYKRALAGDIPLIEISNDGTLIELRAEIDQRWAKFIQDGAV